MSKFNEIPPPPSPKGINQFPASPKEIEVFSTQLPSRTETHDITWLRLKGS